MRKEKHYRINKAYVSIVLMLTLFISAPSYLGAFSLAGTDQTSAKTMDASTTLNKEQFQKPTLSSDYQPVYEMNGKVYRLNNAQVLAPLGPQETIQYNQYKSPEVKIEKIEKPDIALPKIGSKVKVDLPFKAEAKKEGKQDNTKLEHKKQDSIIPSLNQNIDKSAVSEDKESNSLPGLEIKEEAAGDNNLNLLSVGAKTEGKSGQIRNQLKLEGISENPQEEDEIRIVPKIKVERMYQGSSNTNAEQKTGNFFLDTNPIERR